MSKFNRLVVAKFNRSLNYLRLLLLFEPTGGKGAQYHLLEAATRINYKLSPNEHMINALCALGYKDKQVDDFIKQLEVKRREWNKIDRFFGLAK